jgi:hypothetical protein
MRETQIIMKPIKKLNKEIRKNLSVKIPVIPNQSPKTLCPSLLTKQNKQMKINYHDYEINNRL